MVRHARGSVLLAGLVLVVLTGCTSPAAGGAPGSSAPAAGPSTAPTSGSRSAVSASTSSTTPSRTSSASSSSGFDLRRHSVDDPRSIWVVVDERRPLRPKSWVPQDLVQPAVPHTNTPLLRKAAARALERMVAGAKRDGAGVVSLSAYRPYTVQKSIFDRNLRSMGRAAAERLTARPGYSEHQTGLADDLGDSSGRCGIASCFATTPAGRWLSKNAWRYGWILRYPRGQQAVTGIQWEPWHFRYVGTGLARHLHATGQPLLERAFGLPDAPDYR